MWKWGDFCLKTLLLDDMYITDNIGQNCNWTAKGSRMSVTISAN